MAALSSSRKGLPFLSATVHGLPRNHTMFTEVLMRDNRGVIGAGHSDNEGVIKLPRIRCVHCGKSRRRPGGIYCCCLPNEQMIRRNKNPYRCPQCHLAYTD